MSRVRDDIALPGLSKDQVARVCRQAVAQLGWRVLSESSDAIVVKEVSPNAMSFTWAAQVTLNIGEGSIELDGKIGSFGPIQRGHLEGQLGALKNQIQVAAEQSAAGTSGGGLSAELEHLATLHAQGTLSDEEFAQAKARLLGT